MDAVKGVEALFRRKGDNLFAKGGAGESVF